MHDSLGCRKSTSSDCMLFEAEPRRQESQFRKPDTGSCSTNKPVTTPLRAPKSWPLASGPD